MFRSTHARHTWRKPRIKRQILSRYRSAGLSPDPVFSHELRVLVHGLAGSLDLLTRSESAGLPAQLLGAMQRNCDLLVEMLSDAIDVTGQAPASRARPVPQNIIRIVEESVSVFQGWAATRQMELCYVIDVRAGEFPVTARIHAQVLRQLLNNLLSNAIKYGTGNAVVIRLSWLDGSRPMLQLLIEEQGPAAAAPGRFRVCQPVTHRYSSSGLGLKICASLVAQQGGSLGFEKTPGGNRSCHLLYPAEPIPGVGACPLLSTRLLRRRRVLLMGTPLFIASVRGHLELWKIPCEDMGQCIDATRQHELLGSADTLIIEDRPGDNSPGQLQESFPGLPVAVVKAFVPTSTAKPARSGYSVLSKPLQQKQLAEWLITCSLWERVRHGRDSGG